MNGLPQQLFAQGVQHHQAGKLREAEATYRQVLGEAPDHADALHMLGILGHQIGRSSDAIELIRRAVAINPRAADYHANLGAVLASVKRPGEAAEEFRAALALWPDSPEIQNNLGKTLRELGQLDEAIEAFKQAIALRTNLAEAHHQLGDLFRDTGQLDEALASYRRAMALNPDPRFGSSFVHAIHLHPDYDRKRIYQAHLRWNQTYAESFGASIPLHTNDPAPDRRLRIGYVWSEGCDRFLPLITHHDRKQFDIFIYANKVTAAAGEDSKVWRDISALDDQQAMDLVVQDKIDVLVDLNMHTPSNRLLLFARKPAPVQLTGFAYPSTTGLTTIDCRVSDAITDGESDRADSYSEQTLRLPDSLFCYPPPATAVPINPLPATSNSFVTFGCLNDFSAVSFRTIALWAKVLNQIERSRLLLGAPIGSSRTRTLSRFQEHGVEPARVEFVDTARDGDFLPYHRIDICLDTFPWNGSIETFNALWMGVPVVTLAGQTGVSRIGKSILASSDLGQFSSEDEKSFVEIAVKTARDLGKLAMLRSELRRRLMSFTLVDGRRFAQSIEEAYRMAWRKWCQICNPVGQAFLPVINP